MAPRATPAGYPVLVSPLVAVTALSLRARPGTEPC